jgi:hypothetical protein
MGAKFVFFPEGYAYTSWAVPGNITEHQFSFCKYTLGNEYKLLGYSKGTGHEYEKELLVYTSATSGQRLILLKLREHPKVDLNEIRVTSGRIRKTLNYSHTEWQEEGIQVQFLEPVFMLTDFTQADDDLILKGEQLEIMPEIIETEKTKILYVRGKFSQLGFYKHPKWLVWRYPIPVINFYTPQTGAIAVIKNKQTEKEIIIKNPDGIIPESKLDQAELKVLDTLSKQTGETIFAIGYIDEERKFNEEEFKQTVQSVVFDAEFPGLKILSLALPKSSQFTKTKATYQFGPFQWTSEKTKRGK